MCCALVRFSLKKLTRGVQMGFNRFGLGFGGRNGSGLPGFVTTSAPVMSRSGATVNYTPGVYSPIPTGVLTTFYIDDVAQAPGSITFPYTLAVGSRMRSTELPSRIGYAGATVASNEVFYPMPTDIADGAWTYGENDPTNDVISSTETRKTRISTSVAPQSGKEWRAYRGTLAGGDLAQLGTPLVLDTGVYSWVSGGQNSRGATVVCRIAETDIGGANPRWASSALSYTASNVPAAPVVSVAQGAGLYDVAVTLITAADGRGRGVTGYEIQIGTEAAWTTLAGGTATGLRTINTGSAADVAISVRAVNANVDATFKGVATTPVTVTPGVVVTTATYTTQSSIVYRGITMTISPAMPVANFFTGPPVIQSTGPFTITAVSPISEVLDGYLANGAMLDPYNGTYYPAASSSQGFDGSIATGTVVKATCRVPYDAALNRHPTISGAISVASGASHCYVQSKRRAGGAGGYKSVEEYVPFYVLPYQIAVDEFPPPMSNAGSGEVVRKSQINYATLRNVTMPAGARTVSAAIAAVPDIYPHMGWVADPFRAFQNSGASNDNYSAYVGRDNAKVVAALHWTNTDAAKEPAAVWIVKTAITIYGTYQRGWMGGRGAGQWHGYHEILYAGAFLLGHSGMLAAAQAMQSNMVTPFRYVGALDLGKSAAWPDTYLYNRPFFSDEIDKPLYFGDGVGGDISRRYLTVCTPATIEALGPVIAMQNGPGGVTGYDAVLQGSMSPANAKSAPLAFCDRYRNLTPNSFAQQNSQSELDAWDLFRNAIPTAKWTGRPEQINAEASTARFTGVANGIQWNFTNYNWASETVTNRRVMISLDGMLGPVTTGAALSGTVTTDLLGVPHYCQFAQDSASGTGRYSVNYPWLAGGVERNKATPTGTLANAAPSYAGRVTPRIMVPERPDYEGPSWIDNSTPDNTVVTYKCAVGYPSGFPAPVYPTDFAAQWKLDGANIAGATAITYTRDFLTGGVLTCELTVTTTSGSVVYTTPGITVTAIAADPATTLIDTTFGPDFALKYASINAAIVMSGANKVLRPYQEFGADAEPTSSLVQPYDLTSLTPGCIQMDKTSVQPRMYIPIPGCVAGKTYRVITTIAVNFGSHVSPYNVGNWAIDAQFQIERTQGGTDYHNVVMSKGVNNQIYALTVDRTFTADHTGNLWCSYIIATGTGGASAGDIYVASLSVKEA